MMSRKKPGFYKAYLLGSKTDVTPAIPYSTWRRWLITGRITEEHLKEMDINTRVRKARKKVCSTAEASTLANSSVAASCESSLDSQNPHNVASSSADTGVAASCESSFDSQDPHNVEHLTAEPDNSSDSCSVISAGSGLDVSSSSNTDLSDSDKVSENSVEVEDIALDDEHLTSVLNSKYTSPEALNQPLHSNLNVTKFETLLMILHLSMRHRMADVFLADILSLVDYIVPSGVGISVHIFQNLFLFGSRPSIHFYCPDCQIYLGLDHSFADGVVKCQECLWSTTVSRMNDGFYFLTHKLRDQISDILNRPDIRLVSRERVNHVVSDIVDGKMYASLSKSGRVLSNPNALTLTMNTDGSPVFKSGPNSLWPVHFYINEIEPSKRFCSDNIMLGGLWFGKSEANLQLFFRPIVEELKELENRGVVWKKSDGTVVESPLFLINCCTDSVARPKVQNHMQFNGSFGCSLCWHPNTSISVMERVDTRTGLVVRKNQGSQRNKRPAHSSKADRKTDGSATKVMRPKKVMRYVRGEYQMRTNEELLENMELASLRLYDHISGSTGKSVLCDISHFDVVYGFPIDYMHAVLFGTVKRLAGLWFDSQNHDFPFYIGLSIGRVDLRLQNITLPPGFRSPRPLSDRVHWKCNEWCSYLLYFALPVLWHILPAPYYNHFKKLVRAIYLLVQESVLHDELQEAQVLFQEFLWEYEDLYGQINMVFNVHITGHLAQVVSQTGPLWSTSLFPFESANGRLVKMAMGTKGVATQISKKFIISKSASKLMQHNYEVSPKILDFICNLVGFKYLKNSSKGKNHKTALGREFYHHLNNKQKQAFLRRSLPVPYLVLAVSRVVVGDTVYHGRLTTRQKKACDSCVQLVSGEYALIDLIIFQRQPCDLLVDVSFLVTKLNIACDPSPMPVPHIKQCSIDSFGEADIVTSKEIARKSIFYSSYDRRFVADIANFYEVD